MTVQRPLGFLVPFRFSQKSSVGRVLKVYVLSRVRQEEPRACIHLLGQGQGQGSVSVPFRTLSSVPVPNPFSVSPEPSRTTTSSSESPRSSTSVLTGD